MKKYFGGASAEGKLVQKPIERLERSVTCKFCGSKGLQWVEDKRLGKWRVYNPADGTFHNCRRGGDYNRSTNN